MFLKHLFNYSIFISVSASWLNGHLVCMVLLVELDVLAAEAGVGRRGWCSAFGRRGWCFYRLQKLVLAGDAGI